MKFYPLFCALNINPEDYEGTTREKFIEILKTQHLKDQLKIIKGVLKKYPFDELEEEEKPKKIKYYNHIKDLIKKLEGDSTVEEPNLEITSEIVQRAIDDSKILSKGYGAINGVDRIHTALHGYLKAICKQENIIIGITNPTITNLFKEIKKTSKVN